MTDQTDNASRRRPPTIELKATEVGVEKEPAAPKSGDEAAAAPAAERTQAEAPPGPQAAASSRPRSPLIGAIAGGVAGAIVVIAAGAALWFQGVIPTRTAPLAAAPGDGAAVAELSARLKKIESAQPAPAQPTQPQPDPALASRLATAEAAAKLQADQLAAFTRRLDQTAGAAQDALTQAKGAAAAATAAADAAKTAGQGGVARGDLDALATRIAALENAIKKLSDDVARQTASADDRALRLAVASATLRAAVERGAPFGAELAAAKSLGADPAAIAALEPFAATGVPSAASLGHELTALVPALQQAAEPAASNATFLDRLEKNAQRLVRITPAEAPAGDDPATVVTRIGVDAAHADVTAALADIAKLPDAAKPVAAAFVRKAQGRNAALAASAKLAADALKSLGKPQ